jgi:taurine dioxygenase
MHASSTQSGKAGITVAPTGGALGAEIRHADLRAIDDGDFALIRGAWHDHLVAVFRGQELSDEELIAFSRRFGELDWAPVQEAGRRFVEGHPEIYVVSNVVENGVPIGSLGAGEATWHTDMSYLKIPPKASMLYALEVPPDGGDTYFNNMYAAYESLPEQLKRRIEGLSLKHDGTYNSGGYLRQGVTAVDDPKTSPGVYHPLVWSYATRPELAWGHKWRVGDLVLWDNRCTMHRRDSFDAASRRVMHRTQIRDEAAPRA